MASAERDATGRAGAVARPVQEYAQAAAPAARGVSGCGGTWSCC